MSDSQKSLQPGSGALRAVRTRLSTRGELMLAVAPTLTVLAMLFLLEKFSRQQVLFASLASSAFLIYLDPGHGANRTRTLVISQSAAALLGFGFYALLGAGYGAAALALLGTIVLMIALDATHPPAVSTALSFAFRPSHENDLLLFGLALSLILMLVALQRWSVWLLARLMALSDPLQSSESQGAGGRGAPLSSEPKQSSR